MDLITQFSKLYTTFERHYFSLMSHGEIQLVLKGTCKLIVVCLALFVAICEGKRKDGRNLPPPQEGQEAICQLLQVGHLYQYYHLSSNVRLTSYCSQGQKQ